MCGFLKVLSQKKSVIRFLILIFATIARQQNFLKTISSQTYVTDYRKIFGLSISQVHKCGPGRVGKGL
jgi:hypothetical protein